MQTTPLTFDQPFMGDGECGVKYGKKNEKILRFIFFELSLKIEVMTSQKMTNSKNKNLKFGFSFYSVDSRSFM